MAAISTRTISTKLALEGEAEYRAKIKNINAELGLYKSELEKVQAQYKNSANTLEALSSKQSALTNMLETLNKRHAEQAEMLEKAQKAQQRFAEEADSVRAKLEALKNSSSDTADEEKKLADELAAAEENMQKAANTVTTYQKQLNNTERDQAKLGDELAQTSQYLREAEQSADGCAKSIDKFGKEVKDAGEDSKEFGDTSKDAINQLASALAAAGIANSVKEIADALLECVDTFAAFESQMSTVKAISGASGEAFTALAEKAKYMGATTSFTATEAAQALEYMAMAGWKTDDMLNGLEGIMHLAAASGEDLASTSDIVTDALTAFGLTASDSGHFADVLAAASSSANTNVGMMGETFKYAAPVAGALGYSIEDTAIAIGLMANAGIKSTQAGTALRSILSRLASNAGATETQMGALEVLTKNLGVEFYNLDGSTRNLNDVLGESRTAWAGLSAEEQISYGKIIAGQEAMSGWLALMNAGESDVQKLSSAINTCGNAAKEMSEVKLDNLSGQVTLLESAFDGFKMAVGEALAPVLRELAEVGTDAFSWATEFVSENQWLVQAIAGALGAVALLTAGIAAYTKVTTAAKAAQAALNLSMGMCPLVAVTAAVGALVVAVGSWAASLDDADEKTKDFTDALHDSKTAYEDMTNSMKAQQASTRAVASSLRELLAVEEKSALQKDLIQRKVEELNEAVPELNLAYDREKDALIGVTDAELSSLLARAEAQEEYESQVARLGELTSQQAEIEARLTEARLALNDAELEGAGNTQELKNNINELTAAQEENAAQIAALEEASSAYGEQQREAARKTETMTARVEDLQAEMEALEQSYQESYEAAYESISRQMGLFEDLDAKADASISDLIDSLTRQAEAMDEYAANIQRAMELGVDQGLVKKLSDGSEESAKILAEIVSSGEAEIAALNEEFRKVEQGKEDFSRTIAELEEDFSKKMDDVNRELNDTIAELDQHEAAWNAGKNNIQGLIDGTLGMTGALVGAYALMGQRAVDAYKKEVDQRSPSKKFEQAGRYDIQGVIQGAKGEKAQLEQTYEEAAQAALHAMARFRIPRIDILDPSLELSRQTIPTAHATAEQWNGAEPFSIHIDKMEVRNDSDISRIAQELYYLTEQKRRSRGGGML